MQSQTFLTETVRFGRDVDGPAPVLVVCGQALIGHGGAPPTAADHVGRAVAIAAGRTGAVVLDAVSAMQHRDDEAEVLLDLAASLSGSHPVALLLLGGDDRSLIETADAAGRGWPLFVMAGSGGAADALLAARSGDGATDPAIRTVLATGRITALEGDDAERNAAALAWALAPDTVLKDAWRLYASYNRGSRRLRHTFELFQSAIIVLGVLATLLALLHNELGTQALRWAVVTMSIVVGALVAFAGRRATGKRWVGTRAAAEAVKTEIFRYRTRTGIYADRDPAAPRRAQRAEVFAKRLGRIQMRLMHSEASSASLPESDAATAPPAAAGDDGVRRLEPEDYIELRIADQIAYYQARVRTLERRRAVLQTLAITASGAGALIAAAGAETWVALTTAIGAAPLAYLAHLQVDSTIVSYNQSAARLDGLRRRWLAKPAAARTHEAFGHLVDAAEAVMTAEHGGWVEQMTEALEQLQEEQRRQRSQPA